MDSLLSMDQSFIQRLNDVLEENYQDAQFGVRELASGIGVSRSQLHRRLQRIKGVPASEFIKLYRLQKAHILLTNDTSTISEIAYSVGFSSPSYFTKCFHDVYKLTPGEVKSGDSSDILRNTAEETSKDNAFTFSKKWMATLLTIFIVALFSYLTVGIDKNQASETEAVSIGLLPFKNLSNNPENQYFADGVMEVILNDLSGIKDVNVVSRTTMESYRDTDKTIPQIAEELNLSHVLEASVQKYENKVRIVVQLIDALHDRNIWADSYERDFEFIFSLQSDIAQEVARQLEKNLSASNLANMEKAPTENVEAYNLYLKGRFFWQRRKREDLMKSIRYFEQAIDLDPNYAMAYAGMADSYYIMAVWGWHEKDKGYALGKEYARKALEIDNDIAVAHATLGAISFWYEWKWNQAESEIQKAIALDPNYATAHLYYAILLDILGRNTEARDQINLALKINPNSGINYYISHIIFYNKGEYSKALEHFNKSVEITGEPWGGFHLRLPIRLGENQQVVEQLKKMLVSETKYEHEIDRVFAKEGVKGVVNHYLDSLSFDVREHHYTLAALYCLVENPEKALDHLENSYATRETLLPRIKHCIDFETIQAEPRFVSLLQEMNLDD